MAQLTTEDLGQPDLKVAGFQLWIHGRQYPDTDDHDDGNWPHVTAHCGAVGADIWVRGAILTSADIFSFSSECVAMLAGERESVVLDPDEPELKISFRECDDLGHVCVEVEITPDHPRQSHRFEFEIEQSYLPAIIKQCSSIVLRYPFRGWQDRQGFL